MRHTVQPVLLIVGGVVLLTLSGRFRLPAEWMRLPVGCALVAAAWPALVPAVRGDVWDIVMWLDATALCVVAVAHTQRTRIAQLPPGWAKHLHRELWALHD